MKGIDAENRREFLCGLARAALVIASVGGIGSLVARRSAACDRAPACISCGLFRGCDLPQARNARAAMERRRP